MMALVWKVAGTLGVGVAFVASGACGYTINQINERNIRAAGGNVLLSWHDIQARRLSRQVQPLRDEFIVELRTLANQFNIDIENLSIAIVPSQQRFHAASAGSSVLPDAKQYLVLPETLLLNYTLSRRRYPDPFADLLQIQPYDVGTVMEPNDRYTLAHEMAHLQANHHLSRQASTLGFVTAGISLGPLAERLARVPKRVASLLSVAGLVPAFLASQALSRVQERQADTMAAEAGYCEGGILFWQNQPDPFTAIPTWLRSHPPARERLVLLQQQRDRN
jgi:hypothetical protein